MSASTLSVPRSTMSEQVVEAVARGWSVIPVVLQGTDKKPAVKWSRYMTQRASPFDVQVWQEDKRPQMWGVVAGEVSGLVILDFDGEQGCALMAAWGLNPHIRTGSGGYHVYVQHPGWPVKTFNSKSPRPWNVIYPGLDIRADGGYAVFAGRNANGPYEALRELTPDPLTVLPDEARSALGLLTAPEERPRDAIPVVIEPSDRYPSERLLERALEMVKAGEGRDNAAFWLVKQLQDNQYTEDEAAAMGLQYVEAVPQTDTKGNIAPFTAATMQAKVSNVYANYTAREPIVTLEDVEGLMDTVVAAHPYRGLRLVEAPATPVATPTEAAQPQVDSSVRRITYTPLTVEDILNRPMPEFLAEDVFLKNSLAWLTGPPGHYKSFLAYHLAVAVATDTPFIGKRVQAGSVAYIAAEGVAGAGKRIRAYCQENGVEALPRNLYLFDRAIPLADGQHRAAFLEALGTLPGGVELVVVDTQARCYTGNENDVEAANAFINGLDAIRTATGACVLVLHHTGKAGGTYRGSSAFLCAADTMVNVERDGNNPEYATLTCVKQKDFEPFRNVLLQAGSVDLGLDQTSLVLRELPEDMRIGRTPEVGVAQVLDILRGLGADGASNSAWQQACVSRGMSASTFNRHRNALEADGKVAKGPNKRDLWKVSRMFHES